MNVLTSSQALSPRGVQTIRPRVLIQQRFEQVRSRSVQSIDLEREGGSMLLIGVSSHRSELLRHANSRNHGGDVLRSHLQDLSPDLSQKLEGSRSHSTPTGLHTGTGSSHTSRPISRENRSKSQDPEKEAANRTGGQSLFRAFPLLALCLGAPETVPPSRAFLVLFCKVLACCDPTSCMA